MDRRLLILGAGGHARAVAEVARASGWTVAGFTERAGERGRRAEIVGDDGAAVELARAGRIDGAVVGVGVTALARRAELFEMLLAAGVHAPALVHPRAVVSGTCRVGEGAVVSAGAILGAHVEVGANAVCYSGVIVEHDCRIGRHAFLAPAVVLAGSVTVETGAFLGTGAVVVPGVTIGKGAVVGAGALVLEDVPPGTTVLGVPARPREGRA